MNNDEVNLTELKVEEAENLYSSSNSDLLFTVDEAIEVVGFGWFQWKVLFLTGAIWAADAMEIMFISFIIPVLREHWSLEAPWDSMIGVLIFTGMFFGAFWWSYLADRNGRRSVVIIINFLVAVFGTLSALSPNLGWMLFFRTITGIGIGGSVVSYTLFAEYCPSSSRGWALIMEQAFFSFGAFLSVLLAWMTLSNIDKEIAWRWYIGLSALPSWLLVLSYRYIPESARYYSASGQLEKAKLLLRKIFKDNSKTWPEGELTVAGSKETSKGKVCDLFVPAYRRTTCIMLSNFFCATFCYYGICFISERLFHSGNLYTSMISTTLAELPAIFIAVIFIDRTGRKAMMYLCWFAFGVLTLGILLLSPSETNDSNQETFDIVLVFLSRCSVSMLFLVLFVYFSEYYPTVIRSTALGFGSSLGRIAGMITTVVAEDLSLVIALAIYSLLGFLSFALTLMLPQDTTGLKMRDYVDREHKEMSRYKRSSDVVGEEKDGNDIEVLQSGMRGKLQQFRAHAFNSKKN